MVGPIGNPIPESNGDLDTERALEYMDLSPGMMPEEIPIDLVFIGSCTNSRLSDLRIAASIMHGRSIAKGMTCLVVPGSGGVKRAAEREGLDQIFKESGCEWREPGCSMCLGMNGDLAQRGQYVVSTSNRNFETRIGFLNPKKNVFSSNQMSNHSSDSVKYFAHSADALHHALSVSQSAGPPLGYVGVGIVTTEPALRRVFIDGDVSLP